MPLETQAFIRIGYGILFLIEFLIMLPFSQIYFTSEKYHGCIQSSKWTDTLLTPRGYRVLIRLWMGIVMLLVLGVWPLWITSLNLFFCYTFFIRMRWTSITRGMGAPGFIPTWLAHLVFWLEYSTYCGDPQGNLRPLVIFTFQFDFAIMMIDSGINKIFHGYPQNMGMNYGMANPAWSYWPEFFHKLPFHHPLFTLSNHAAYIFQILGGVLMLIPGLKWFGAFLICAGFLGVKCIIRLGVLCDMLMLITAIYTVPNGWLHQIILGVMRPLSPEILGIYEAPTILNEVIRLFFYAYLILLPAAKLGMYYNLYGKKSLPEFLQIFLEKFTNAFGIILWRVFTIDTVDFFIRTYFEDRQTKQRTLYTRYGRWQWGGNNRFLWVGESVMMDIVFNTERFFPQTGLLRQRLLRYAKTMPCPENSAVVFEYVVIRPDEKGYPHIPAKEFRVDLENGTVEQVILNHSVTAPLIHTCSPVQAGKRPGSYAPAITEISKSGSSL